MTNDLAQNIMAKSKSELYGYLERINRALNDKYVQRDKAATQLLRRVQALVTARLQVLGAEETWAKAVHDYREGGCDDQAVGSGHAG